MRKPSEVVHSVKCAVCEAIKQKSNNWWEATFPVVAVLRLAPMRRGGKFTEGVHYLCGMDCVTKLVTEYMSEQIDKHVKEDAHARESSKETEEESVYHNLV